MAARVQKPPRTVVTILLVAAGAALTYAVPELERFSPIRMDRAARLLASPFSGRPTVPLTVVVRREPELPERGTGETRPSGSPAVEVPQGRPEDGTAAPRSPRPSAVSADDALPVGIEDPTGQLERFFLKLEKTEGAEAGAVTRISHFGDSPLTGDLISGDARSRLQAAFGDGGHGFVLAGRPWAWYGHRGISLKASGWRILSPLLAPGNAGFHGLAGVTFSSRGEARTQIELDKKTFSRLEVTFTRQPGGGTLLVSVDGGPPEAVSTAGPARETASFSLAVPAGGREVLLRSKGDGDVAVHGVVLENDGPGVVYDALGANGASVHFLSLLNASSWEQALSLRRSDLVILGYGTNESGYWENPGARYRRDHTEVIDRIRRALPGAAILLMAPMDRGMRGESGDIVTMPSIPKIVEAQRQAARESGVAFFDTFTAMGGEGTMARWYESEPRLVTGDFTHTTHKGSARVASLLSGALEDAYATWKRSRGGNPERPAAPAPPPP